MQRKHLVLLGIIVILIAFGLYKKGVLFAPEKYPVLSNPNTQPFKEVPALFSQSGTVTAMSASSITIRYAKPAPSSTPPLAPTQGSTPELIVYTTMTFPISSATPVFSVVKDVANGKPILKETVASLSDITIGTNVTIHIGEKTLAPVAPIKIQLFPR